jgi:hypothetical protein
MIDASKLKSLDYLCSSARAYHQQNKDGLLEDELLQKQPKERKGKEN